MRVLGQNYRGRQTPSPQACLGLNSRKTTKYSIFISDKGFKSTVINRTLLSLHEEQRFT